ncbi:glycosyltransferase family 20-domain-containing protein [Radiomyces spectabilis]|uniref:glycosyltransferase family 20-domain-containing protein n=1 Tax=Radiomyces spectabilis TaxID=64574 RepID=UPI002220F2FD|nr:glycosyltransferase family 20-domain-containing protein [Radiomyces spectabilis]KAI8394303.1 glycosyltransferase family 20-domain-containing protein [Radiomyces spectabilis]
MAQGTNDIDRLQKVLKLQSEDAPPISGKVIHVVNQVPFDCILHTEGEELTAADKLHQIGALKSKGARGSEDFSDAAPISHLARRRSTVPALGESPMWRLAQRRGHSAMYAGLDALKKNYNTLYIGGTGNILTNHKDTIPAEDVGPQQRESLRQLLRSRHDMIPIFLESDMAAGHYEGYCKQVLWPLLHYMMWDDSINEKKFWEYYVAVNEVFAKEVAEHYEEGDIVWIHDYHLLLVPHMLRELLPDAPIGIFIHTPFPSSELFRCLPRRKDILSGMLGANLIAFQTYNYARHFSSNCTRILGYEYTPSGIDANGVMVALGIYPIGIDVERTKYNCSRPGVAPKAQAIREKYGDKKIIVGRDKLDPVKGVVQKLESFEKFLTDYPEWRDKVVLIQVTSPGVIDAARLENKAAELVSRINSKFGSLEFCPVAHFHQHIDRDEYYALLEVADIALVTPITDGMNTASLEYVVAQEKRHSPLILSEFTGTARSMSAAVIVNPWDYAGVARAISECLTMSDEEKLIKYKQLQSFVYSHTAAYWAKSLVKGLVISSLNQNWGPTSEIDRERLKVEYKEAQHRLLFFDYDGTLTPIVETPEDARPSEKMIKYLTKLCEDPHNTVWVVSGRDQDTLDSWVGHIPNLGLSAEHGCFIKDPGSDRWISVIDQVDMSWKDDVKEIFEYYKERTPGSFIEEKRCALTWHYRKAEPRFGAFQANELQNHLEQSILGKLPIETLVGKKNLEVRPTLINKGEVIKRAVAQHPNAEFTMCAGDDKTDEDMFRALQQVDAGGVNMLSFTITIGPADKKTLAKWHINTSEELVDLLGTLSDN